MFTGLIFASKTFMQSSAPAFTVWACIVGIFILFSQRLPERSLIKRLLNLGGVQYIGRRSYGLYLMHYPVKGLLDRILARTRQKRKSPRLLRVHLENPSLNAVRPSAGGENIKVSL